MGGGGVIGSSAGHRVGALAARRHQLAAAAAAGRLAAASRPSARQTSPWVAYLGECRRSPPPTCSESEQTPPATPRL